MNDCIEWIGPRNRDGYGRIYVDGKDMLAHRWVYQILHRHLPEAVMHTCDNPPCVNIFHLLGGTQEDNMRDAARKGRLRGQAKDTCDYGHNDWGYNTSRGRRYRRCRECHRRWRDT